MLIYAKILRTAVPTDGRNISRREVKLLQAQGVLCNAGWWVYQKEGISTVGVLFDESGGDTGIVVSVKMGRYEKYGF